MKTGAPNVSFGTNPCYGGKRDVYRSIFHVNQIENGVFATDNEKLEFIALK